MKYFLFTLIALMAAGTTKAQKKITLEDIWRDQTFATKSVPGFRFMKDGKHYTRLEHPPAGRAGSQINKYDITTGKYVGMILNGEDLKGNGGFAGKISSYTFGDDEKKILIISEKKQIYRRSFEAEYHVYNFETEELIPVFEDGLIMNATFSPDASKVAYVWQNDLYYFDIKSRITLSITDDGKKNHIINGSTDWVYEEEFSIVKAFWWSPDNDKIAYIRFDESDVKEFTMTYYDGELYPRYETFKYPKVGEKNAELSIHIYDLESEKIIDAEIGDLDDMYIPRVKWTKDPSKLCVFKMNRHQNHLQLLLVNSGSGKSSVLLDEKNKYYIDITDDLTFLENGREFIWTSEKSGFNHIYLYNMHGKEVKALTKGNYDVTDFYGVDEKRKLVYYQAAEASALEKKVYKVNLRGTGKRCISPQKGTNAARFSSTFDYYTLVQNTINSASTYIVFDRRGKLIRTIEENENTPRLQKEYEVQPVDFFSFATSENVGLNGWMIKPPHFQETNKYPVLMYLYGGPGSQQVVDAWKGSNYWWFQMLAQQGYVVACVDNRGTGARGEEFKKSTYLSLGHLETIDQIEAAKYVGALPYTDASRIGIFGWSYGGYMSSLCLLKGNDVFKAAIAVAPVTNWRWYDTIYTERYMRTEAENEEGYKNNSPVYFADRLKGNYLLVHGSTDDNVHFQNSMEMASALIKANKQYDTYIYPGRNHGIHGDNARLHLYTKMTNFLDEKLKNGGLDNVGERVLKP